MKRFILAIISCVLLPLSFRANSQDSLKALLSKVKEASYFDSTRFFRAGQNALKYAELNGLTDQMLPEINIYYGNFYFYTRRLDSSSSCFNKALNYSRKFHSTHFETLAKVRLIYIERENGLMNNAEEELNVLLKESIAQKDYENELEIYNLIGIIQEEKGEFKKAVESYIKGLSNAELNKKEYYQATFLNNIGLVKYFLGEQDKALVDFNNGIKIATKINNQRLISHIKMNICLILVSQNKIKEAGESFKEVITYAITNKLPLELASAYVNLSTAYLRKKEFNKGINYVDSAINVFQKYNYVKQSIRALLGKCNILIEYDKINEAEAIVKQNEALVLKSENGEDISELYFLKYKLMQKKGRPKEALEFYIEFNRIKDSVSLQINSRVVDELQIKYNVQKKEIELEKEKSKSLSLEKSNQKESFLKWLAILLGIILSITGGVIAFVIYNKKLRQQQEHFSKQLIIKTEEERSRIAKDLHDDIGQSLSSLKTWLFNDDKNENNKKIENEVERIIDQTRQISRALYPSYIEKIGLTPSISMLAENVQKNKNIEFSFDVCEKTEELSLSTKTHLFRIIQECVSNTLKHSGASALKIIIEYLNNEFVLTYIDNGSWVQQNKTVTGMGLLSIKERIKIINGVSVIEQNQPKGFKLVLKFKNQ